MAGAISTALIVTVMTGVTASNAAAGVQASTAQGVGVAYGVCAAISAVALVLCVAKVRAAKRRAPEGRPCGCEMECGTIEKEA